MLLLVKAFDNQPIKTSVSCDGSSVDHCNKYCYKVTYIHVFYNSIFITSYTYGSSVEYICDPGYKLVGSNTLYCAASGAWSGDAPQCLRKHRFHFVSVIFVLLISTHRTKNQALLRPFPNSTILVLCCLV